MLGIVFTEFQEYIEETYSPELYDDVIEDCSDLKSQGVYTSIGRYDYSEMLKLVNTLSERTSISTQDLIKTFGHHLFGRFQCLYPEFFEGISGSFEFLKTIENHIHIEVKKLYPEAELPTFEFEQESEKVLIFDYQSQRPFADLAEGLLRGCMAYYHEEIAIQRDDIEMQDTQYHTRFILEQR
ncbi:heme NO-binding domain-containing protein [Temperatibacter marinus]|uniref:Heme NO-binding domain-containing protein n=1 Tax=Temperatibacter marinus TaxID=1456591 RepID=A0AA52EFA2_9PROT|nr:heme NO-binding domain-containing protein [Temperatibacter marinus]WND01765.1 heme NO-binding domain-containing protein [Temperatibacter marinus]